MANVTSRGLSIRRFSTPSNAPSWMSDRPILWNSIELFDKPKNAQLAREFQIDLPLQLSLEQNIVLAKEYAQQLVNEGMVVDLCIYAPDKKILIRTLISWRLCDLSTLMAHGGRSAEKNMFLIKTVKK